MNTPSLAGVDVGYPKRSGTTKQSAANLEVIAGGEDIWGDRDEFHFACVPVSGNFELSARLVSLTMADLYTKAGLMLRSSLEDGAEHAMLLAFGDNQPRNKNNGGIEFQSRVDKNVPCSGIYPPQPLPSQPDFPVFYPHVWLKLIRCGDTITGQTSEDGKCWRTFCVHQQRLPQSAYLGLAVASHHADQTVKAVFSDLNFSSQP